MNEHCGMKYLLKQPSLSVIHARWMTLINEFDFKIKHIKRKENKVVETLNQSIHTICLVVASVGDSKIQHRINTHL
jgi:hypothetical protein